jgi:hypothetical protein
MNHIEHRPIGRRAGSLGALLLILLLSALGLTQCRMVDETITGVDIPSAATHGRHDSSCRKACRFKFKQALKEEAARYRKAKRGCHHNHKCLSEERRIHEKNVQGIRDQLKKCETGCYGEGSGFGGR